MHNTPQKTSLESRKFEQPLSICEDKHACWRKSIVTAKSKPQCNQYGGNYNLGWQQITVNFCLRCTQNRAAYFANKNLLSVERMFFNAADFPKEGKRKGGVVLHQKHPEIPMRKLGWRKQPGIETQRA